MTNTLKYDLDTDTTLGGNSASDYVTPSQKAIKSYVDNHSGGSGVTDVKVNNASVVSGGVANIVTNSAYNASSNKIATMSDLPTIDSALSSTSTNPVQNKVINSALSNKYDASNPNGYTSNVGTVTKVNNTSPDSSGNVTLSIPAAQVNSDWNATSGKAQILNKPSLSTVATSGSYNDLSNKPTIPTVNNATLTIQKNGSAVKTFTANASADVTCNITVPTKTSDLTNDSGYTTNTGTVTSVNNVSPVNGNVSLTIPSVGNGTITITQGGTTKGTFTTNQSGNSTIELDAGGGASRNVGEIVQSTFPLIDAGLHLLDGTLLQYGSYKAFIDYIASIYDASANYFCSESEWQTAVTNYGSCPCYVYNSTNNTVRLPKRTTEHGKLIKSNSSGSNWYRIYEDGWCEQGSNYYLPSGVSEFNVFVPLIKNYINTDYCVVTTSYSGVAYTSSTSTAHKNQVMLWSGMINRKSTTGFYLNRLNEPDGNNVNWYACGYTDLSDYQYSPIYEYLVIANTTKTEIETDIDNVMTDLNGKADRDGSNMISSVKNFDGQWIINETALSSSTAIGTYNIDLSSILPSDNYNYEIQVHLNCSFNNTGGTGITMNGLKFYTGDASNASSAEYKSTNGLIVIDTTRILTMVIASVALRSLDLSLTMYRRIGTNS